MIVAGGTAGLAAAVAAAENGTCVVIFEKTGIDLNGLRKTSTEYNQACDTGRDKLFDRKPRY